jgi:hypothetical protein
MEKSKMTKDYHQNKKCKQMVDRIGLALINKRV